MSPTVPWLQHARTQHVSIVVVFVAISSKVREIPRRSTCVSKSTIARRSNVRAVVYVMATHDCTTSRCDQSFGSILMGAWSASSSSRRSLHEPDGIDSRKSLGDLGTSANAEAFLNANARPDEPFIVPPPFLPPEWINDTSLRVAIEGE